MAVYGFVLPIVLFVVSFRQRSRRTACSNGQADPAALGLRHRNFYQDFIGWPHPFHRHRITMFRRTNDEQRPIFTFAQYHLDFPPGDDFPANEAITFLIQGVPLPELIESLQRLQFFFIG